VGVFILYTMSFWYFGG